MLAFGTSDKDPYQTTQYLPPSTSSYREGYLTSYAERKLRRVFEALNKASLLPSSLLNKARKAHLKITPEEVGYPEALEKVVTSLE